VKKWYAVMTDNEDTDWGTGFFDEAEAISWAKAMREDGDYSDAYVAIIDVSSDDPNSHICVGEIRDFD